MPADCHAEAMQIAYRTTTALTVALLASIVFTPAAPANAAPDPVAHATILTQTGRPTALPSRLVVPTDGTRTAVPVTWASIPSSVFTQPGRHTVAGTLADGRAASGVIEVAEPASTVRVSAVGDSITAGLGTIPASTASYPGQLGTMLGTGYSVQNFGVSGRTVLGTGDSPYAAESAYRDSLNSQPDVVLFQLGTNDSKPQNFRTVDRFVEDYRAFLRAYLQLPSGPAVYAMLPPTVHGVNLYGIDSGRMERIDALMLQAVSAPEFAGVTVVDNHTATLGSAAEYIDGVHPGNAGSTALADGIRVALTGTPVATRTGKLPAASLSGVSGMFLTGSLDASGWPALRSIAGPNSVSFSRVDFSRTGTPSIQLRVATPFSNVTAIARIDSATGPVIGRTVLRSTDALSAPTTQTIPVQRPSGVHDLYLSFERPGVLGADVTSLVWVDPAPDAAPVYAPGWSVQRPAASDALATANGGVTLTTLQGDALARAASARNELLRPAVTGAVSTQATIGIPVSGGSASAGLALVVDDRTSVAAMRTAAGKLVLRTEFWGIPVDTTVADPAPGRPLTLKLDRSGTTVVVSTSVDGTTWTRAGSVTNIGFAAKTQLRPALVAVKGVTGADVTAAFSAFAVNGTATPITVR